MPPRKKKYESGEAAQYIKRGRAIKKLQISFRKFRRLCILKGIYPRVPRNRKKAQKGVGSSVINCLYYKKDIRFLLHEPILWTMLDYSVHRKKMKRAYNRRDFEKIRRLQPLRPKYSLDHIVKERYPTFIDALNDLDDALTLCFYFANLPHHHAISSDMINLCRRLTLEFLHYVIEARALRKVFVSIKGFYYQAEIKGQTITWIRQHNFGYQPNSKVDVDFSIMGNFVEFYVIMLGFVNFRLYSLLNLQYPPQIPGIREVDKTLATEDEVMNEMVAALNHRICRTAKVVEEEELEVDMFSVSDDPEKVELVKKEAQMIKKQQNLFKGLKFFLGREVPRESLVFVVQAVGGEISWEKDMFIGATFDETDESITHQIVDRPYIKKKYLARYYIQPQWVYDSINARILLPVEDYFPGEVLPPHLSPFSSTFSEDAYIPPEEKRLLDMKNSLETERIVYSDTEEESEVEEEEEHSEENHKEEEETNENEEVEEKSTSKEEEEEEKPVIEEEEEKPVSEEDEEKSKMVVLSGQIEKVNKLKKKQKERMEVQKLREMLIKRKHRRLYLRLKAGKKKRRQQAKNLVKKRKDIDEKEKKERKMKKKMIKLTGGSEVQS